MTSNLGSQLIQNSKNKEEIEPKIQEVLKSSFRPEFLNRIDYIVIFNALTKDNLQVIIDILASGLKKRLKSKNIDIQLSDRAKQELIQVGYDPNFGARPLKRAITKNIENPLAIKILKGVFSKGDTVAVDYKNGFIII